MSSRGRTDVETLRELDFRFSNVVPNSDDKFTVNFTIFLLSASFGICRVLQFEGRSKVFEVGAYESFKNLVPYAFFEVVNYKNFMIDSSVRGSHELGAARFLRGDGVQGW